MPSLDTNILVRWLTNDDPEQCSAVTSLLKDASHTGETLFVPITVLLEMEWVLRSRYKFGRDAITTALDALLSVSELEIQAEAAAEVALWLFKNERYSDFADCLHVGLAGRAGRRPLLTFDKRASSLTGAALLN